MKIARATVLDDSLIIGPFRSDGGTQLPTVKMCIRFTDSKGEQWGSIYWPKLITIKERTTISLKVAKLQCLKIIQNVSFDFFICPIKIDMSGSTASCRFSKTR